MLSFWAGVGGALMASNFRAASASSAAAALSSPATLSRAAFACSASLVRQAERNESSIVRARLTFSRMSEALAVQMNGLGFALCWAM